MRAGPASTPDRTRCNLDFMREPVTVPNAPSLSYIRGLERERRDANVAVVAMSIIGSIVVAVLVSRVAIASDEIKRLRSSRPPPADCAEWTASTSGQACVCYPAPPAFTASTGGVDP